MKAEFDALCNQKILCSCGREHFCPIERIQVGRDALQVLPEMLKEFTHICLAADENTYAACGESVREILGGRIEKVLIYHRSGTLVPDEEAISELENALTEQTDFILGVGSGVINDLSKYVSWKKGMDYGIVATAPSMDGYASSGAAMILGGMKVTETTRPPRYIVADVRVLSRAPLDMIRAGYGDIIGKYSALCDWKLSHLIGGEHFCREIYDLVYTSTCSIRAKAKQIAERQEEALGELMNALLLIGVTLSLLGSTRPGSGSEHHLSHFFEIVGLIRGEKHFPHGTDVAYSTVVTAGMRDELKALAAPVFREESEAERKAAWERIYGPLNEQVEQLQTEAGSYQKNLQPVYAEKWQDILAILSECPSKAECEDMLLQVDYALEDFENLYGAEKIRSAMFYGKDLKNRYSVLWLYYAVFSGRKQGGVQTKTILGEIRTVLESVPDEAFQKAKSALLSHRRVFFHAAGRSALMLRALAMRLSQMGLAAFVAGETTTPAIEQGDLLILASASGNTPGVCQAAKTALAAGADLFTLSAAADSALARLHTPDVLLPAGSKETDGSTCQPMGSLFEQSLLIFCDALILCIPEKWEGMKRRHANLE